MIDISIPGDVILRQFQTKEDVVFSEEKGESTAKVYTVVRFDEIYSRWIVQEVRTFAKKKHKVPKHCFAKSIKNTASKTYNPDESKDKELSLLHPWPENGKLNYWMKYRFQDLCNPSDFE